MHLSVVLCQNISYCVLLCIHEAFDTGDNGVFMYCKNMLLYSRRRYVHVANILLQVIAYVHALQLFAEVCSCFGPFCCS
jgi:hypothetical protein